MLDASSDYGGVSGWCRAVVDTHCHTQGGASWDNITRSQSIDLVHVLYIVLKQLSLLHYLDCCHVLLYNQEIILSSTIK